MDGSFLLLSILRGVVMELEYTHFLKSIKAQINTVSAPRIQGKMVHPFMVLSVIQSG